MKTEKLHILLLFYTFVVSELVLQADSLVYSVYPGHKQPQAQLGGEKTPLQLSPNFQYYIWEYVVLITSLVP